MRTPARVIALPAAEIILIGILASVFPFPLPLESPLILLLDNRPARYLLPPIHLPASADLAVAHTPCHPRNAELIRFGRPQPSVLAKSFFRPPPLFDKKEEGALFAGCTPFFF
jgi:hypothetical protein